MVHHRKVRLPSECHALHGDRHRTNILSEALRQKGEYTGKSYSENSPVNRLIRNDVRNIISLTHVNIITNKTSMGGSFHGLMVIQISAGNRLKDR